MSLAQPSNARSPWIYRVWGLSVASEFALPEAQPIPQSEPTPPIDVRVELGSLPDKLVHGTQPAPWLWVRDLTWLMRIDGIGRFLVEDGRKIVVEAETGAAFDDVRVYLLGSAFGAMAHQRGLMPWHVSAVVTPVGAIAFTGESGAGKSTLAAHLNMEFGWPLICDDTTIVFQRGGVPCLASGLNTLKLWRDALPALDLDHEHLRRDLTRDEKFHAFASSKFTHEVTPLRQLVKLEWGEEIQLEKLAGRNAYAAILSAIYRADFAPFCSNVRTLSRSALTLAAQIGAMKLTRPRDPSRQSEVLDLVASNLSVTHPT